MLNKREECRMITAKVKEENRHKHLMLVEKKKVVEGERREDEGGGGGRDYMW